MHWRLAYVSKKSYRFLEKSPAIAGYEPAEVNQSSGGAPPTEKVVPRNQCCRYACLAAAADRTTAAPGCVGAGARGVRGAWVWGVSVSVVSDLGLTGV